MKFLTLAAILIIAAASSASALYGPSSDVIELTASNFQSRVVDSNDFWLVEFYAPWCGHCKSLAPEWDKAATALKGFVKVGAVNMDEHQSVGGPYGIKGFPTIKFFGANKASPMDYNQDRSSKAISDFALQQVKSEVSSRLSGKKSSSNGSGSGSGGNKAVIELTDSNFKELVLDSQDIWLVEFFAPWCGHCKSLEPAWEAAAKELKGKVKLGALDATVHQSTASGYDIRGYPTIKLFGSNKQAPEVYDGGRSTSDIVSYALSQLESLAPPPEVLELVSQESWDQACGGKQLCIVAFLPDILDSNAAQRNKYIETLKTAANKHKTRPYGYVWVAANAQSALEKAVEVGGYGYPAVVAVAPKKSRYAQMLGALSDSGLDTFLSKLQSGKERTNPLSSLPTIIPSAPWDGKDGELPVEQDEF